MIFVGKEALFVNHPTVDYAFRRSFITGDDKEHRFGLNLEPSGGVAELFERVPFPKIDFPRHA